MKLVKHGEVLEVPVVLVLPVNTTVVITDEPETGKVILHIHSPTGFDFDDTQTVADELSACLGKE